VEIKRTRLNFNREKQVLVNLILNTEYCEKVLPIIQKEFFQSRYAGALIRWVKDYYEKYLIAPREQIIEIFEERSKNLEDDEYTQIEGLLEHLSNVADTEVHNITYLIDVANNLFKEKHLELQNKAVEGFLKKGELVKAEEVMQKQYQGIEGNKRKFIAFNDEDFIYLCVRDMIEQQDLDTAFFRFSGRLGEFIGPVNSGWFIAFLAPAKRGKTTYMLDSAIDSINQKLNTAIISLEMPEKQLMQRYILAITGAKPEFGSYVVNIPIMDCRQNQDGSCEKAERVGSETIINDEGKYTFQDMPNWTVCTACRGGHDFIPAAWKVPIDKDNVSEGDYLKKVAKFNKYFGKFGRIIHMPSKSVTVEDIRAEIAQLIITENFIPDTIVLDYADLVKPSVRTGQKRHDLDEIWEELRAWGQEDNALIISASQTNRVSADVEYIKDTHVAEDYSKIAKLDIAIGLCQNDIMKEDGMININVVAHRHNDYIQSHFCTVLQAMDIHQSSLDSEFVVK